MRYMSVERAYQLKSECVEDLERAKILRHRGWIETLTKRLASLNKLLFGSKADTCVIVEK